MDERRRDERRGEIDAFQQRAHEALSDAAYLIGDGRALAAVARTYYAAFYVATAAVLTEEERPKTHRGLHTRFHLLYVRTGRMDAEIAGVLRVAMEAREGVDYDAFTEFDVQAAQSLLDDVRRFVEAVNRLLEEPRDSGD